MTSLDFEGLKDQARGRWDELLAGLGIEPTLLDSRRHSPCPKCGGTDRFRFTNLGDNGSILCNKCGKTGDGVATVAWWLGVSQVEAAKLVANRLGLSFGNGNGNGQHHAPGTDIVAAVARVKRIPSVDALKAFGAEPGEHRNQPVATLPVYGADGRRCGSFHIGADPRNEKLAKGVLGQNDRHGVFLPNDTLPQAGEHWVLVEGVKDAATLHHLGFNAAGLCTSSLNAELARLFAGAEVTVVPDLDEAGSKGARLTAARLCTLAEVVRIARLPGEMKPERGDDVRDVLRRLGADAVKQAIADAREWTPNAQDESTSASVGSAITAQPAPPITLGRELLAEWSERYELRQPAPRIDIGMRDFRVAPGAITMLAAGPGVGKSTLALQWSIDAISKQSELKVLYASAEMPGVALIERTIASRSGVSATRLRDQPEALSAGERHAVERCRDELRSTVERFATMRPPYTMTQLDAAIEYYEPGLVVLDYLQLFHGSDERQDEYDRVGQVLRHCRTVADSGIAIIAIVTMNRAANDASYERVTLGRLRGSGEIEYTADEIYGLWHTREEPQTIRVAHLKSRYGETRPDWCVWRDESLRISTYRVHHAGEGGL